MTRVVAIGAGQAAASLAAKLRSDGFDGEITLIGAEPEPPYQRPPLSKAYLKGETPLERLYLRPLDYYADQNITLLTGRRATAVDLAGQAVKTGGERIPYDHLVFATGSAPRRLPAAIGGALDGVYTVRSIADIDAMAPDIAPDRRALIVGGGYIGLEAAAVAAEKGLKVTVVEMAERILQRVASPETSDFFRALHQSKGVDIREGVGLNRLIGDGRVTAAELADGARIDVDLVIVGIGIAPETALAEAAGIALDNGVATDAFGRTSAPNVWAAGDCASFPHQGGRIRLESVPNAIEQAEAVAANIMGAETPYMARPWFWSDQYDVKLQIAGLNAGYDAIVARPGAKPGAQSLWYFAGERFLAIDAMNDPGAFMVAKRLLEQGKPATKAAVGDPDFNLKTLLR